MAAIVAAALATVMLPSARAADVNLTANNTGSQSSFNSNLSWSDGLAPSAGNAYFTQGFTLRTPLNSTPITFAGDSLTVNSGGLLAFKTNALVTVNNLILAGGDVANFGLDNNAVYAPLAGSIDVTATSTFDPTSSNRIIDVRSSMTGAGGIVVQGSPGATTIYSTVAKDYTGDTSVSAGAVLRMGLANALPNGTGRGNLSLSGTFDVNGFATSVNGLSGTGTVRNGSATAATLTLGSADVTGTFAGTIVNGSGTVALTKNGTGTLTLSGSNTFTGATLVSAGTLALNSNLALQNSPLDTSGAGRVTLGAGVTTPTLGGLIGATSLATEIASGYGSVTSLTLNVASGTTATYSGAIADGAAGMNLTKTGAGTQELSGSNSYTGTTTVSQGMLSITSTAALPGWDTAGRFSVASGATLTVGDGVSDAAVTTLLATGNFAAGSVFGVDASANRTLAASLSGAIGLVKFGSGTVTLSADNSYTGGTLLNAGALALGHSGALGSTGTISFAGGRLQYTASNTTDYSDRFSTAANQPYSVDTNGQPVTWATPLTSSGGSLTKSGAGVLTLTGANTYTGTTTLSAGVVNLGVAETAGTSGPLGNSPASNPGSIVLAGGTLQYSSVNLNDYSGRFSTAASQQYNVDTNGQSVTWGTALTSSGGLLRKVGSGTLTLLGASTYAGPTTVDAGVLAIGNAANSTGSLSTSSTITVNSGATLRFVRNDTWGNAAATTSSPVVVMAGGTLASSNSFTTLVNLTLSGGQVVANGGANADYQAFGLKGTLTVNGTSPSSIVSGTVGNGTNAINIGPTDAVGTLTIAVSDVTSSAAADLTVSANLKNNGNGANVRANGITKTGAGTLVLAGTNTFTGRTRIDGGTILYGVTAALYNGGTANWTAANLTTGTGAVAAFTVGDASPRFTAANLTTILGMASTGSTGFLNGSAIGIDTTGTAFTYSSAIANHNSGNNALGLRKLGSGTLTLTAASNFTGPTTVEAGKLVVNGSLANTSALAIYEGAALGGSGSIGAALSGAGLVSPGNSPGILTATQFDPTGGLDVAFEFTGASPTWSSATASINDVQRLTGATPFTAALGGSNTVNVLFGITGLPGGEPIAQGTYTGGFFTDADADFLTSVASADFRFWVLGTYGGTQQTFEGQVYSPLSAYDSGLSVNVSTVAATANFAGGTEEGRVTQFIVVPEPGALALAGLGVALAAAAARRRHRGRPDSWLIGRRANRRARSCVAPAAWSPRRGS